MNNHSPSMKKSKFFQNGRRCYSVNISTISKEIESSVTAETDTENSEPFFKHRYIVSLFAFFVFNFLDIHRMNMSVGIVDMVNNSASLTHDDVASESCPLPDSDNELLMDLTSPVSNGEFDWNPKIEGYVLSSGFVGQCLTQFISGKLAETFGSKWILFSGVFLSSACTFLTPYAAWWNVYSVIVVQTLRGMGQGTYQPGSFVLIANWFPKEERGTVCAITMSGQAFGAVAGSYLSGLLCKALGWPYVFYIFGMAGIILSILMAIFLYENPSVHPYISKSELKYILSHQENKLSKKRPKIPWRAIFSSIPVYASIYGMFGQFWLIVYFTVEHPLFLDTILNYPIEQNGLFTALPFFVQIFFALSASFICNFLQKRNYVGVDKLRKFWTMMACFGFSAFMLGIPIARCNRLWSIICSILSMSTAGFAFAGCLIVSADMSPTFAGTLTGLTCTIGATASFILPVVVGFLTNNAQTFEQWDKIFFLSIGVVLSSGIIFTIFGSADVQPWNFVEENASPTSEKKEDGSIEKDMKNGGVSLRSIQELCIGTAA